MRQALAWAWQWQKSWLLDGNEKPTFLSFLSNVDGFRQRERADFQHRGEIPINLNLLISIYLSDSTSVFRRQGWFQSQPLGAKWTL